MRLNFSRVVAGLLKLPLFVACLKAAVCAGASATTPSTDAAGVVAYVEQYVPQNERLADIAEIKRHGVTLETTDLMVDDEIYITRGDTAIIVRRLADNRRIAIRRATQSPFIVKAAVLPGLTGKVLAWFKDVLVGANQARGQSEETGSRAVNLGTCYNEAGNTNEPIPFRIPILGSISSALAAGTRAIFVSWQGGARPFSVTLSTAETDRIVAQVVSVRNVCAVYLPQIDLPPGRYRLQVTDGNNVKEEEDNLFVVSQAPVFPRELSEANLPEEARQLYAATWLSVQDGGKWAFEAQQQVASMDCQSAAVQDWLQQWGGLAPCVAANQ
jgi:hypothetical protein